MKKTTLTIALTLIPAALMAQQAQTSTQVQAKASVQAKGASAKTDGSANVQAESAGDVTIPDQFSASARAKMEASFKAARAKHLPQQPMQRRIAEGQAKAASETQIVASVQKTEAQLEASQSALVRAGRTDAQPQDIEAGADAMAQGATEAQVRTLAQHTPSDRSLVVAVDVLSKLVARGLPVSQALAQIQAKLDAGASDEAIGSLASSANVDAAGALNAHGANPNAAGAAVNAAGNAAAGVTTGAKGLGGAAAGVTGAVTGAAGVRKP